jgi:hypothetical protein
MNLALMMIIDFDVCVLFYFFLVFCEKFDAIGSDEVKISTQPGSTSIDEMAQIRRD